MEIRNRGNRKIVRDAGKGVFFLAALLFIFLHVSAKNAESLVCNDCHITSPHSTGGSCDSADCQSCHVGKLATVTHPSGTGTPLDFDLSTVDGRTAVCKTCHGASGHPTVGAGVDADVSCGPCHGGSAGAGATVKGAPYLTLANLQVYAQVMHGGTAVIGGPTSPDPVQPPVPGLCDGGLQATGTLTGGACATDSSGLTTCNISLGSASTLTGPFANQTGSTYINWGDGSGMLVNPASPVVYTYRQIGKYQITQTVTNPCGYTSQKNYIVNVAGVSGGKGTLKINASGADGRAVSYKIINGGGTQVTYGTIVLDASKGIILDSGTYTVKIGYASVIPMTDPVKYHKCDALAGGSNIIGSDGTTVIGQSVSVTVTVGGTTTVTLANCD